MKELWKWAKTMEEIKMNPVLEQSKVLLAFELASKVFVLITLMNFIL
jgi:hypothetical protein